jgi:hypothetical protein
VRRPLLEAAHRPNLSKYDALRRRHRTVRVHITTTRLGIAH